MVGSWGRGAPAWIDLHPEDLAWCSGPGLASEGTSAPAGQTARSRIQLRRGTRGRDAAPDLHRVRAPPAPSPAPRQTRQHDTGRLRTRATQGPSPLARFCGGGTERQLRVDGLSHPALLIGQRPLSITEGPLLDEAGHPGPRISVLSGEGAKMRYPMAIKICASAEDWQVLEPLRLGGGIMSVENDASVLWLAVCLCARFSLGI